MRKEVYSCNGKLLKRYKSLSNLQFRISIPHHELLEHPIQGGDDSSFSPLRRERAKVVMEGMYRKVVPLSLHWQARGHRVRQATKYRPIL